MPKKRVKTYLAGAFCPPNDFEGYADWRDFVIERVKNPLIEFYDPRIKSRQLCPATFTLDDAMGVLNSDILFHYRRRGFEDEGASWEHGIAFACNLLNMLGKVREVKGSLIVYVDSTRAVWPLNFASANVNFSNLETAVDFLNLLKSTGKKDWISVYMKLIDRDRIGG